MKNLLVEVFYLDQFECRTSRFDSLKTAEAPLLFTPDENLLHREIISVSARCLNFL